jgi:predicted ArsR family transcriptional regulator
MTTADTILRLMADNRERTNGDLCRALDLPSCEVRGALRPLIEAGCLVAENHASGLNIYRKAMQ